MKVCSNLQRRSTLGKGRGAWFEVKSLHSWLIQYYTKSKMASVKKDQRITKHIFHKVYQPHNKVFYNKDFKCTLMNNGKTLDWCLVTIWVEEFCCIWLGLLPTRRWGYDNWWRKKPFGLTKSTFMSHNIKMSLWYKRWKVKELHRRIQDWFHVHTPSLPFDFFSNWQILSLQPTKQLHVHSIQACTIRLWEWA